MLKGGQRIGAGRPAVADSRRHLIQFRVTEDELRDVKETASHLGLTVTDLVRKALGLAVVVLLAVGCSVERPVNPPADPPAGADAAAPLALEAWSAVLLPDGRTLTDPPPILWFDGECLEYESDPYPEANCLKGLTWTGDGLLAQDEEIHLIVADRPSDTALAHELLHWSLDRIDGDPDSTHTRAEWNGVAEIRAALAAEGV